MAQFYAEIQGNRGSATRMGSKDSGISGHIRGWRVGANVHVGHFGGSDVVTVSRTGGSEGGKWETIAQFDAETGPLRTVEVPAPLEPGQDIDNARRAAWGAAGVQLATPDYGQNGADAHGRLTDAGDAIANILHWLADGEDNDALRTIAAAGALERARRDFYAELIGNE